MVCEANICICSVWSIRKFGSLLIKSFSPKIHILIVLKLKLYFILSNIVVEALDIYSVLFVLDINKRNASSL